MAALAHVLYRTDAFAAQGIITGTETTHGADVLASRERQPRPPSRFAITLVVDGTEIQFTYTTLNTGLPRWATAALESFTDRWATVPEWDSYDGKPTDRQLVVKLLNILSDLLGDDAAPPQITPLADGGVQAEWHAGSADLEIVVPAGDEPTYYYFNRSTQDEEEGNVEPAYARVRELVRHIA